ncbi:hypothetical protein BURCENBC7_AP7116 [Burkholderia cenocepacia BC7]|nr:hypothetical protein BURCENK562V_C1239 [Burkholderia cenocepacia K56-2Valvano]ERI29732.1 hypothetical protein BURCENBC7_AP7116 [Burkholderia cenocepacia BC7]
MLDPALFPMGCETMNGSRDGATVAGRPAHVARCGMPAGA